MGFPRHLSQHVGGFVITRDQLDFLVPISNAAMEDRTVIEWDKNDIEALEILKVDVLALGMLTCIRRAFDMMHVHYGMDLTLQGILDEEREDLTSPLPWDDRPSSRVYKMTHRADTLGVFQIESRAQMSMLPRLRPKKFYDLVIEVAIVRPGPIQGGMVHPYLKRRMGLEPKPDLSQPQDRERFSSRTYGVPAVPGTGDADRHCRCRLLRLVKPTSSVGPWRPGSTTARSTFSESASCRACMTTGTTRTSPPAVSSRSRALASMAFRRATQPRSRSSSTSRAG